MAGNRLWAAKKLLAIHCEIRKCQKCRPSLLRRNQNIPRSGFPASDKYVAMIIGAEPGGSAQGHPRPEEYLSRFAPECGNRNKARLILQDLKDAGIDWSLFFFTNAVKCPATKRQAEKCFAKCREFLDRQIRALSPQFIVVLGTATHYMDLPTANADSIRDSNYLGVPIISVRHPQGATMLYRQRVVRAIRARMKANRIAC